MMTERVGRRITFLLESKAHAEEIPNSMYVLCVFFYIDRTTHARVALRVTQRLQSFPQFKRRNDPSSIRVNASANDGLTP